MARLSSPALLALDVGSSSAVAALLRGTRVVAASPRVFFRTRHVGTRVDVDAAVLLRAVRDAIAALGPRARRADALALAVMSPAWVAMDSRGHALTPIVTHQDRRSVGEAREIERRVGRARHLRIAGARPFPGGISSTTWLWFSRHEADRLRGVDLVGHLNTFLHRQLTGARVIDPSNASFTGLYRTLALGGWSDELCDAAGVDRALLPEVFESERVAGRVTREGARRFGLVSGLPVLAGLVDGSAGMLLAGARVGQLYDVCGSTDVLALCTDTPRPHPRLLTRALGIGRRWLAVGTLAAVGSALYWARAQLFRDLTPQRFAREMFRLSRLGAGAAAGVRFDPYMAGERMSIEQRAAAFSGITLAATRENLLSAMIEALIEASARRLALLGATGTPIRRDVVVSGGADRLDRLMTRDWPGRWRFRAVTDATLRGLGTLVPS